jgi:flagellar motor protein MotB
MITTNRKQPNRPAPDEESRVWRLEPLPDQEFVNEDSHSWAVSYSDLLMVLMSFFILFFSYNEEKPTDLLRNIALSLRSDGGGTGAQGDGSLANSSTVGNPTESSGPSASSINGERVPGGASVKEMQNSLKEILQDQSTTVTFVEEPHAISISFDENTFEKREFKTSPGLTKTLDRIFEKLGDQKSHLKIYFIGHTDHSPVSQRSDGITDNFVLSSLRASSALRYAIDKGFSPTQLFTQGAADNLTPFRTISLKIEWIADAQGK